MIKCPQCGCEYTHVIDVRPTNKANGLRRRRECEECQERFTTYELDKESLARFAISRIRGDFMAAVQETLVSFFTKDH